MEGLCQEKYLKSQEEAEDVRKRDPAASSSSPASDPWQGKKLARLTTFWDQQASTNFIWRKTQKASIMMQIQKDESGDVHGNSTSGEQGTGKKVESTKPRVISILGQQGAGKTFLARRVYNEAIYLGFVLRAWVHVSATVGMLEFLFEILKQVDKQVGDMRGMNLYQITDKLYRQLASEKFLIVLDDVRLSNEQPLERLLTIIPPSSKGCIITTTQDNGIATMVSPPEDQIKLEDIQQKEIQEMLAEKLHRVPNAKSLTNAEAITQRCPRLPLCISLFDRLLSNAGEQERKALLGDGSTMTISDILELSYHRLPDHLKPCFIYMALFPIASPISTKRLVKLWLAEGLLDLHCYNREGNTRLPEDVGETFILELADRNVIDVVSWRADGSPKACQMLTSLYDMIRFIEMSTGFLHIHAAGKLKYWNDGNPTGQQQQPLAQSRERARVRWLAEHMSVVTDCSGSSYPDLNLDHVRSFLSFYPRRGILTKDISKFLGKLTSKTNYSLLRVLDLEGVYKPSLQGVIHMLVLLRYLGLRSTVLDSIPREVGDLHYLETLDIKHTNITLLPSSLWKARNMRHLHLNWFYVDLKKILKACSNNVKALTQLQTLSGLVIGEVDKNLMRDHTDSFTTLTTLKLYLQHSDTDMETSGAAGKALADWISFSLTNLQSLTFGVIQEAEPAKEATKEAEPAKEAEPRKDAEPAKEPKHIGPLPRLSLAEKHHYLIELYLLGRLQKPIWTELLPGSLRVLTLSGSKVEIDMMPELGGLLKNLRTLRLLANSFRGTRLKFVKDGFPSLVILKIWRLPKLEKVFIEPGAMTHLRELECRFLYSMKDVEGINGCGELETICVVFKKDAHGFVENLRKGKQKTANLYTICTAQGKDKRQ
ncbi:hypothetical protein BT93_J1720 [Corymbia citriodora subsp. variegata]|nr:hypothetical protein BT93_J1720 [Corymbia citriodora subsp. variegata]